MIDRSLTPPLVPGFGVLRVIISLTGSLTAKSLAAFAVRLRARTDAGAQGRSDKRDALLAILLFFWRGRSFLGSLLDHQTSVILVSRVSSRASGMWFVIQLLGGCHVTCGGLYLICLHACLLACYIDYVLIAELLDFLVELFTIFFYR